MAISLFQLSVPTYIQTMQGVDSYLKKGLTFCADEGIDPNSLLTCCLHADQWALDKQIIAVCHHSLGAVQSLISGTAGPPPYKDSLDYEGLVRRVAETLEGLNAVNEADINSREGEDVTFAMGDIKMPFTAENFVTSFSFPNCFFHATTGYDILRQRGVPLAKRDFMGRLRMKT